MESIFGLNELGGDANAVSGFAHRSFEYMGDIEGIAYQASDELILTDTMRERKRIMYERSDGYVALAGGYGTLEEFLEVLTLRKLGYHDKSIVLLNTNGFYDELISFFEKMTTEGFASEPAKNFFTVVNDPTEVLPALELGD